jgi:hypothetical protein
MIKYISILIWFVTTNPYANHHDAVVITRMTTAIIRRETGITLRPYYRDIRRSQLNALGARDDSCTGLEIYCNPLRSSSIAAVLTEPLLDEAGNRFFYGFADRACHLHGGLCEIGIMRVRQNNTDGIRYAAYGLAHEVTHLLGSNQDRAKDCSLGDTQILYCLTPAEMHLNKVSKAQINMCLRRNSWMK